MMTTVTLVLTVLRFKYLLIYRSTAQQHLLLTRMSQIYVSLCCVHIHYALLEMSDFNVWFVMSVVLIIFSGSLSWK